MSPLLSEFPGGVVILPALSFPPFQKCGDQRVKLTKKPSAVASPYKANMIPRWDNRSLLHRKNPDFNLLANNNGAVAPDIIR